MTTDVNYEAKSINYEYLKFDSANPRVRGYITGNVSEDENVSTLVEYFAVDELVESIVETGYWSFEPMIVMGEGSEYTVLEGNRRLAAIKVIREPALRSKYISEDIDAWKLQRAIDTTEIIDCFVTKSRYDSWHLIGFKHINGPQRWDSVAKAAYIYDLTKQDIPVRDIAKQLGDRNRTVTRLLRAYAVLLQAERSRGWNREYREKKKFAFSHLMTGLEYNELADYIGLEEDFETSTPPVATKPEHLTELMTWLYGDTRSKTPAVVQSQNPDLGRLKQAMSRPEGISELRRTNRLDYAVEASRGDAELLKEALHSARSGLERATAKISTGFSGEEEIIRSCVVLAELSDNLLLTARRRKRTLSELE